MAANTTLLKIQNKAGRFNRKIEEILNETPNAETENKLKKINQLFLLWTAKNVWSPVKNKLLLMG